VIDIIIDEEPEAGEVVGMEQDGEGVREEEGEEEEGEVRRVEAKTDVVRCKYPSFAHLGFAQGNRFLCTSLSRAFMRPTDSRYVYNCTNSHAHKCIPAPVPALQT
jgi:hypothetical protein